MLALLESACSLNEGLREIWGNVLVFFIRINVYGQENNRSTCSHVFHGSFLSSTKSQTTRIPPLQYPVYDYMPLYGGRRAVQVHRNLS